MFHCTPARYSSGWKSLPGPCLGSGYLGIISNGICLHLVVDNDRVVPSALQRNSSGASSKSIAIKLITNWKRDHGLATWSKKPLSGKQTARPTSRCPLAGHAAKQPPACTPFSLPPVLRFTRHALGPREQQGGKVQEKKKNARARPRSCCKVCHLQGPTAQLKVLGRQPTIRPTVPNE